MDISKITVFIFDVNGVLIDSNQGNAGAMAEALSEDPELWKRIADLYMRLGGIDRGGKIRAIHEKIFGRAPTETEFKLIWNSFRELSSRGMLAAPTGKGSREVLVELGRRGVTRVALSNTPFEQLSEILIGRGFDKLLDIVRGGGDWPKSESLKRLLEEFDFEPHRCLLLADGRGDLAAARSAGVPFVGIGGEEGEFSNETDVEGAYPDLAEWARAAIGFEPESGN